MILSSSRLVANSDTVLPGWNATITPGVIIEEGDIHQSGFTTIWSASKGSMSDVTVDTLQNATILRLVQTLNYGNEALVFIMNRAGITNSGWENLTVRGKVFQRRYGAYRLTNGNQAEWTWATSAWPSSMTGAPYSVNIL